MTTYKLKITTNERLTKALDIENNSISTEAYEYLHQLLDSCHGDIEELSLMDGNDGIGITVFEDSDGDQILCYGGYGDANQYMETATVDSITVILDIAESGDKIPEWWDDNWTVVGIYKSNGYTLTTKEPRDASH